MSVLCAFVGRHRIAAVVEDAEDDLALVRLARDDGDDSVFVGFSASSRMSSRRPALRALGVGPVAVEAVVRHDRPDVAVEGDFRRSGRLGSVHAGQGNKGDTEDEGDFFHQGNVGEMTGRERRGYFRAGGFGEPVR